MQSDVAQGDINRKSALPVVLPCCIGEEAIAHHSIAASRSTVEDGHKYTVHYQGLIRGPPGGGRPHGDSQEARIHRKRTLARVVCPALRAQLLLWCLVVRCPHHDHYRHTARRRGGVLLVPPSSPAAAT